ncbi:MAG: hypothetical protein AB1806_04480 [Acidobacteriota bacterium]
MKRTQLTPTATARYATALTVVALAFFGGISCGGMNENGRSPSYLFIEALTAASGAKPDSFANLLESDVITNVRVQFGGQETLQPTIFEDTGRAVLRMALKDVGAPNAPTTPTSTNAITVTRYRVEFRRTDGRSTPGVDVPYAFDGGATGTFDANGGTLVFVLVRAQAKLEEPLKSLRGGGGAILLSTIADVTFYGHDQNGNAVSVTGQISVNFADWGDPTT